MSRVELRLGLTEPTKRLAFYYLSKGIGSHAIEHHIYDEVIVEKLYDWHTPNERDTPAQGGLVVKFMRLGEAVRWVEFGCHYIGGGGAQTLKGI
jgi:hypothetical protein